MLVTQNQEAQTQKSYPTNPDQVFFNNLKTRVEEGFNWKIIERQLGRNEKFVLQRVVFCSLWYGHEFYSHPGKKFVANSIQQWTKKFKDLALSYSVVYKIFKQLVEEGFLIREKFWITSGSEANKKIQLKTKNQKHHFWYAVNFEKLEKIVELYSENQNKSLDFLPPCKNLSNNVLTQSVKQSGQQSLYKHTNIDNTSSSKSKTQKKKIEKVESEKEKEFLIAGKKEQQDLKSKAVLENSKEVSVEQNVESGFTAHRTRDVALYEPKVEFEQEATKNNSKTISEATKTTEKMIQIWNDEVFYLTESPIRAFWTKYLFRVFVESFDSSFEKWKDYAKTVLASDWMMGRKDSKKNFKASFAFLLKQEVIEKLLAGGCDVQPCEKNARINKVVEVVAVAEQKYLLQVRVKFEPEFQAYMQSKKFETDGDIFGLAEYAHWYFEGDVGAIEEMFKIFLKKQKLLPTAQEKNDVLLALYNSSNSLPENKILDKLENILEKLKSSLLEKFCTFKELALLFLFSLQSY